MEQDQTKKDLKDHKFPHLQKEIDSLLENFDYVAYGIDEALSDEQSEFNHINVDDVMIGRIEKKVARPKISVVEKARLQERKAQALHDRDRANISNLLQGDILLARRETKSSLKEVRLISPAPKKLKDGFKVMEFVKLVVKYLKF